MKQRIENTQKCEFVLKLENNIVCQRFFSVRNFNNKENDRLTFIAFIRSITDVNLKNGYLESRKLAPFMFVNDINNS